MSEAATSDPPSPYHAILGWAAGWPVWQQDALRRIVGLGLLSAEDLDELEAICLEGCGLTREGAIAAPTPQLLAETDLPAGRDAASSVTLARMADLTHVNRLAPGQVLDFGPSSGLTIIYGENGSGKSGYARVLKKACRARGSAPEIKPDALSATPAVEPARATIGFRAGTVTSEVAWQDGVRGTSDPRLANVFVFDAISADSHAGADEPACFTPRGLDVLPKLAAACDELKRRFKALVDTEYEEIGRSRPSWKARSHTKVGRLLASLGEATTEADVESLSVFTDADRRRLTEIGESLKSDPRRKAQETTAAAARVRAFATLVSAAATAQGDERAKVVRDAIKARAAAIAAERATAGPKFDESYLDGTGGAAWARLWAIAETFSTTAAYPGQEFPVTAAGSRCVLCQQTLDESASQRLGEFHKYVRNEARRAADTAREQVEALQQEFVARGTLGEERAKVVADLAGESESTRAAVQDFVRAADTRLAMVKKNLDDGTWAEPGVLPVSPVDLLNVVAAGLDERAKMELSADEPERRKLLVAEMEELEDREWLVNAKAAILAVLGHYSVAAALKRALGETTTNQLTMRSGELQDSLVTTAFCDAFQNEIKALGLGTLPVEMRALPGAKGTRPFGVRLAGVGKRIVGIASEGEERCVALAACLAELSQASHRSALVFDDPVSSLDYKRRDSIAARLAREAKTRQVVVFTHNLAFVCDLQNAAAEAGLEVHGQHLAWSGTHPGKCLPTLPWEAQSYKSQSKELRERVGKADMLLKKEGEAAYREVAKYIVDDIRAMAERVVEEVLFNRIIVRHESRIQVGHLQSLSVLEPGDLGTVHSIWKYCSEHTPGHAAAHARPAAVPEPAKLLDLIETLDSLSVDIHKRRQGKTAAAPPPVTPPEPVPNLD